MADLASVQAKIVFATGEGHIGDLEYPSNLPNFSRPSSVILETSVEGSIYVNSVPAYIPAYYPDDGAFLVTPFAHNMITHCRALQKAEWQKGERVTIQADEAKSPTGDGTADIVGWTKGTGNGQLIQRSFTLEAAREYTLSAYLLLAGGEFGNRDEIRLSGEVADNAPTIKLLALNDNPNRWALVHATIKAGGRQPQYPQPTGVAVRQESTGYAVSAATANSVTLSGLSGIGVDDFVGGVVTFHDVDPENRSYEITGNSASTAGNEVVVVFGVSTLLTDGVTTASRANLGPARERNVTLQVYVENAVTLYWGGIQLEPSPFLNPMIFTTGFEEKRAPTQFHFLNSPLEGLNTFGIMIDFRFWRGFGNILDCGNFKAEINEARKLAVTVDSVSLATENELPEECIVFIQLDETKTALSIFVDGKLEARTNAIGFEGDVANMKLESDGIRAYRRIVIFDRPLAEGTLAAVGDTVAVEEEVGQLFKHPSLVIPAQDVAGYAPNFILNTVIVPAPDAPTSQATVSAVTVGTNTLTVTGLSNFAVSDNVVVVRDEFGKERQLIARASITNTTAGPPPTLVLTNVDGILPGDIVLEGNYDNPGTQSATFPFTPSTSVVIEAIDVGNRLLTLESTLSVEMREGMIFDDDGNQVRNVLLEPISSTVDKDDTARQIKVGSVADIQVGMTFVQVVEGSQQLIDPANLSASIIEEVADIDPNFVKANNGVVVANRGKVGIPVTIQISTPTY